jgi:hypothetical protein
MQHSWKAALRRWLGYGLGWVWDVCSTACTDLHVFPRGTMNSTVYVTDILQQYVVPFTPFIGDNIIFKHDYARPQSVRIGSEYLDEVGFAFIMQWPARSQYLNRIENVWDMMGRRVWALQPPPARLGELGEQIIAIWDNQDKADVLSTINSTGRRCEAAIHARGGNIRY